MKITFVINTLKVGGAAKMIKYVANLATEMFEEVSMINMYDSYYDNNDLKNIKVVNLGLENRTRLNRKFTMIPSLRKSIVSENPDIVCAFVGHVNVIAKIATLRLKDVIFISAERGDPFTETFLWKKLTTWTYKISDYCFFQLDRARDFFGSEVAEKSFVIPNPFIPTDNIEPYNGVRRKTIISAGRFAKEKCYDILIDAFAIILKKHPDYQLILCGDGPMLSEYKKQIANLEIQDNVIFPGYVKSVSKVVREEGIFVLSSLYEGIPNSLIEAMSVGIPCISTDCTPGGPAFLFNNETRGMLVPTRNVNAMTEALLELIENSNRAKNYGQKALEVIEELNEEKIRLKWESAFEQIIKECTNV